MSLKIDTLTDEIAGHPDAIHGAQALDEALGVVHHFADGLYAKEIRLPAGSLVKQHAHDYDHLSIFTGAIELTVGDNSEIMSATKPRCLVIKKGEHHGIRAITDVTWYCIHHEETALWPS